MTDSTPLKKKLEEILDNLFSDAIIDQFKHRILNENDLKGETLTALERLVTEEVQLTEKAFGGCKKCYGKGYATWRHGETYRGATHNMRNDIKFCDCDRGKQLSGLVTEEVVAELKKIITDRDYDYYSAMSFETQVENRIATLTANKEEQE